MKVESRVTVIAGADVSGLIAARSAKASPTLRVWRRNASPGPFQRRSETSAPVGQRQPGRSSGPRGEPGTGPVPVSIDNVMA